jgi:hypothetical protein
MKALSWREKRVGENGRVSLNVISGDTFDDLCGGCAPYLYQSAKSRLQVRRHTTHSAIGDDISSLSSSTGSVINSMYCTVTTLGSHQQSTRFYCNNFFPIYGEFGDLSERSFGHVCELKVVTVQYTKFTPTQA